MTRATTRTSVTNLLVIGTGAAGLRAAIAGHDAGVEVTVVGKRPRKDAHTVLAAGGINAVLGTRDPDDSWQQHAADTLAEGYFLPDPTFAELLARDAPAAIAELDEWGCDFARTDEGAIDQRYFGAHTYRRTCYAGDYTGRAILDTLADRVTELGIDVIEDCYVSDLLVDEGRCFGALAFDQHTGDRTVVLADAVVLAAGGHTRLWRQSSSRRDENTGDAMALALRAGATLADMELVQFHPTGMVHPEDWAGVLVTEAVRGEGGVLRNAEGERFMERYDAERLELSSRDRVALANYSELRAGRGGPHGGVFLDVTHLDRDQLLEKLPRMYRQFLDSQLIDIASETMEVAPTAHYSMGGVVVEPATGATEVRGLYAAGEATAGLHGANRLGGNSLAETVVFGRRAGEAASAFSLDQDVQLRSRHRIAAAHARLDSFVHEGREFARPLQRAVRDELWRTAGVVRDEETIDEGLATLGGIREAATGIDVRPSSEGWTDLAHALDLDGSLLAAEATLLGARERRESRGAHTRSDHPDLDPNLGVRITARLDEDGSLVTGRATVPSVPEHLRELAQQAAELEAGGERLLE
ncbi:FAD-binding protein [Egibacter rhizosphaerae]|uniref:FAD-binding protein n=1 Tax=Egibacter rhizosphaerae TaxID=1670831 RepID=A0A411YJ28_9ACTN|nr:FAD-dependent oxidoreductase [Egibacter rhizosphaerae]QBI21304.1 FAD-binding protein [Egibacter rhizosphaerae]